MSCYVYVLRSVKFDYTYIGHTDDVGKRLREHNRGKTRSNRRFRPFVVIYIEKFETRIEAVSRERYLKSGSGREFLKSILKNAPVVQLDTRLPARQGISDIGNELLRLCS
jgi:putative endonuclease